MKNNDAANGGPINASDISFLVIIIRLWPGKIPSKNLYQKWPVKPTYEPIAHEFTAKIKEN